MSLFYIPSSENLLSPLPFPPVPLLSLQSLFLTLIPWQLLPWVCLLASESPMWSLPPGFFMYLPSFFWILSNLFCLNSLIKWTNTFSNTFWAIAILLDLLTAPEMADDTSFFFGNCQFQWIFHFWGLFQIMGIHFYFSSTNISWISPLKGSLCCQWETYRLSGSQG